MGFDETNVAIVIPSCDAYSDTWRVLIDGLEKFWPFKNMQIYLITNHLDFIRPGVKVIRVGNDVSWADNFLKALDWITQKYILINIDDLVLVNHVPRKKLHELFDRLVLDDVHYYRLNPTPKAKGGGRLVAPGELYRSSTQFSVWKKEVLQDVLIPGENAWEFEILGSARTDKYPNWFASPTMLLQFVNLVIKGKVSPIAERALSRAGLIYISGRPRMTLCEQLIFWLKEFRSSVFSQLPKCIQRPVRAFFPSS